MMLSARCRLFVLASVASLALSLGSCGGDRPPATSPCASSFDRLCPDATGARVCVPVTSDPNNCGNCGYRCAAGEFCRAGACAPGVPPIDGGGLDFGSPGACSPLCPSMQYCCGTSCVNRSVPSGTDGRSDSSFDHCGDCATACDPMTASACSVVGSSRVCTCGILGAPCAGGQVCARIASGTFACQTNCGATGAPCAAMTMCCGTGDAAMCLDTQTDNANCGTCGHVCGAGTACTAGVCEPLCGSTVCTAAQMCCDGACVPAGVMNCGACGVVCAAGDACGTLILSMTVCCGMAFFPGIVTECTIPDVDAGAPDAGDVDAGDADAGDGG